ncbi:uncharacterized protein LOC111295627 [Durio zibethinus]|uniref:Uncharacterized protein LOC111295627 n=1 Tax=Durio zibethinus TaxID=66656 RepID=A0A6P5YWN3_DURZI|nr:uncharacterized protein LOC111295627 [Durio zibethinus]
MVSEYKEFDSEQITNGNLVDVTNGTDKVAIVELQAIEPLECEKSGKELAAVTSKVTQITADVVVETFPLRPVAKPTDSIDGSSSEVMKLNGNLDQTENLKAILASNGIHPNIQGTYTGSSSGKSTCDGAVVVESKVDAQRVISKKGSNKPLELICKYS